MIQLQPRAGVQSNNKLSPSQEAELDELLTEQTVFDAVVSCQGNSALASEQLLGAANFEYSVTAIDYIKRRIPTLLVSRMVELKQHMEAISTLELFSLMPLLHQSLKSNLSNLEAGEAVTAYMKLMELIGKKTDANEVNINVNDRRFGSMPKHLQQLFMKLEATGQIEDIVDGEYKLLEASTDSGEAN